MLASVERIPSMWESDSGSDIRVSVPPPLQSLVPRPPLTVESPPRERESCPVRADLRNEVEVLCQPRLVASGTGDGGGRSEGTERQLAFNNSYSQPSIHKQGTYLFCSIFDESPAC